MANQTENQSQSWRNEALGATNRSIYFLHVLFLTNGVPSLCSVSRDLETRYRTMGMFDDIYLLCPHAYYLCWPFPRTSFSFFNAGSLLVFC